jgi:hypothetical protein
MISSDYANRFIREFILWKEKNDNDTKGINYKPFKSQ